MQRSGSKTSSADQTEANRRAKAFRQLVQNAVSARARGAQSPQYDKIVNELKSQRRKLEANQADAAAEFHFVAIVEALTACASAFKTGSHDVLLTAALGIPFWQCSKLVRQAVLDLCVELIVASSTYIPNCLQVFIFNFLPPPGSSVLPPDVRGESWVVPEAAVGVQEQLVDAIEKAVQLVPVLPTRLLPMLIQSMPHKLRDRNAQCLYLRALLLLAEGKVGPTLRDGILQGIVEHLLGIDADIKWEEIVDAPTGYDHEEGSSEGEEDEMFEIEGMSELDISGNPSGSHHQQQHQQHYAALQDGFHDPSAFGGMQRHQKALNGKELKRPPVDEMADKLDSLMEMVFEHLQRRIDAGQLGAVWQTMLSSFERTLLHAHRCKFTQYLVFFLALKDPERCCSSFVACLMSHLRDGRQPAITRSACAAYLASFLARCAPAPAAVVVETMQKLAADATQYAANAQQQGRIFGRSSSSTNNLVLLQTASSNGSSSNSALAAIQRHQTFYATVQALLYLLCYHMQPLLRPQQQSSEQQQQLATAVADLVKQQVLPLLAHQLAPLAVCHEAVTSEFVRQAMLLGLADSTWETAAVDAVQQHQAAVEAAVSAASAVIVGDDSQVSGPSKVLRPLEVFFPFDPYLLQRSSKFLQLENSYICFSNGQPHVSGDVAAIAAVDGGSDSEDSDDLADEAAGDKQALLQRAHAVVTDGTAKPPRGMQQDADSDDSSSTTSDDPDTDSMVGSLQNGTPGAGLPPAGMVRQGSRQHRPGVVPVGFARGLLAGPSPPADLMATSLQAGHYLGAVSYSPGEALGMSPTYGGSPMAMSYQNEGYMQNVAQLHAGVQ